MSVLMSKKLIKKNSILLQLYARAEAPCRDYYGLSITEDAILMNTWKVSYGPHLFPKSRLSLMEDIKDDKTLQDEIKNTFGMAVFEYIKSLYLKEHKLENLPKNIFLRLLNYLKINDILNLGQTNRIFKELCNDQDVWKIVYTKLLKRKCYPIEIKTSVDVGWREMTRCKIRQRQNAVEDKPSVVKKAVSKNKLNISKIKIDPHVKRPIKT